MIAIIEQKLSIWILGSQTVSYLSVIEEWWEAVKQK